MTKEHHTAFRRTDLSSKFWSFFVFPFFEPSLPFVAPAHFKDSYKVSHWKQYPPGTQYVYSVSVRSVWDFGLQRLHVLIHPMYNDLAAQVISRAAAVTMKGGARSCSSVFSHLAAHCDTAIAAIRLVFSQGILRCSLSCEVLHQALLAGPSCDQGPGY